MATTTPVYIDKPKGPDDVLSEILKTVKGAHDKIINSDKGLNKGIGDISNKLEVANKGVSLTNKSIDKLKDDINKETKSKTSIERKLDNVNKTIKGKTASLGVNNYLLENISNTQDNIKSDVNNVHDFLNKSFDNFDSSIKDIYKHVSDSETKQNKKEVITRNQTKDAFFKQKIFLTTTISSLKENIFSMFKNMRIHTNPMDWLNNPMFLGTIIGGGLYYLGLNTAALKVWTDFFKSPVKSLKRIWGFIKGSLWFITKPINLIKKTVKTMSNIVVSIFDMVKPLTKLIPSAVTSLTKGVSSILTPIVADIKTISQGSAKLGAKASAVVGEATLNKAKAMTDADTKIMYGKERIKEIKNTLNRLVTGINKNIDELIIKTSTKIKSFAVDLTDIVTNDVRVLTGKEKIREIKDKLNKLVTTTNTSVDSTTLDVNNKLSTSASKVSIDIETNANKITNSFDETSKAFKVQNKKTISDIIKNNKTINGIITNSVDLFDDTKRFITTTYSNSASGISNKLNEGTELIKNGTGKIRNAVTKTKEISAKLGITIENINKLETVKAAKQLKVRNETPSLLKRIITKIDNITFGDNGLFSKLRNILIGEKGVLSKLKNLVVGENGIFNKLKNIIVGENGIFSKVKKFFAGENGIVTKIAKFLQLDALVGTFTKVFRKIPIIAQVLTVGTALWEGYKAAFGEGSEKLDLPSKVVSFAKAALMSFAQEITSIPSTIGSLFGFILGPDHVATKGIVKFGEVFSGVLDGAVGYFLDFVLGNAMEVFKGAHEFFKGTTGIVYSIFTGNWQGVKDHTKHLFTTVVNTVLGVFENSLSVFKNITESDWFIDMTISMSEFISKIPTRIKEGINFLWDGVKDTIKWFRNTLDDWWVGFYNTLSDSVLGKAFNMEKIEVTGDQAKRMQEKADTLRLRELEKSLSDMGGLDRMTKDEINAKIKKLESEKLVVDGTKPSRFSFAADLANAPKDAEIKKLRTAQSNYEEYEKLMKKKEERENERKRKEEEALKTKDIDTSTGVFFGHSIDELKEFQKTRDRLNKEGNNYTIKDIASGVHMVPVQGPMNQSEEFSMALPTNLDTLITQIREYNHTYPEGVNPDDQYGMSQKVTLQALTKQHLNNFELSASETNAKIKEIAEANELKIPALSKGGIVEIHNNEAVVSDLESKRGEEWAEKLSQKINTTGNNEEVMEALVVISNMIKKVLTSQGNIKGLIGNINNNDSKLRDDLVNFHNLSNRSLGI